MPFLWASPAARAWHGVTSLNLTEALLLGERSWSLGHIGDFLNLPESDRALIQTQACDSGALRLPHDPFPSRFYFALKIKAHAGK